jgi:hypothetical protein
LDAVAATSTNNSTASFRAAWRMTRFLKKGLRVRRRSDIGSRVRRDSGPHYGTPVRRDSSRIAVPLSSCASRRPLIDSVK